MRSVRRLKRARSILPISEGGERVIGENPDTKSRQGVNPVHQQSSTTEAVIHTLLAISAIGGVLIGIFVSFQFQSSTVWTVFATIAALLLAACLKWQGHSRWIYFSVSVLITFIACIIWQIRIWTPDNIKPSIDKPDTASKQSEKLPQQTPAPPQVSQPNNQSNNNSNKNPGKRSSSIIQVPQPPSEPKQDNQQPEMPVEKITVATEVVPSQREDFPFGLRLTIQSTVTISPVHFLIECNGPIDDARAGPVGGGVVMMHTTRLGGNRFEFRYEFPPLTPQRAIQVYLFSARKIGVLRVNRLE